ncbi:MAG: deoxynucleoside kinase [Candidatus Neomarinimicrobiota bacterium]|jgi:deoxyadenosine/deoxycytidine kinase|nr:deoxynucleoside kinase [Candidatus Neomarinimicrobiota bacterium]|tara:strand:+ start:414 stop:1043 length:630 start_codon:yes stop_codon:yes gene_type:complete
MIESYIAIEGPIGVGKTSLAEIIADKLNTRKALEDFEENPFLDNFYDNIEEYAFQTQMFFLLQRYKQQQEIKQLDVMQKGVVTDYMFDKDRLFASFTLSGPEMELYSRVADILEQDIIKPDLVVYLQADTPLLMQYIKKRGRDLEKGVTSDYIDLVNQRYQEFFVNYEDTPLLIINTNNIDFVENPRDLDELLEIIQKPVQGTKYFNPS